MADPTLRIRKLLALAHDQRGTPEGELAARRAREVLRRHARAASGLSAEERDAHDPIRQQRFVLGGGESWCRRRLHAVASHCAAVAAWPRGSDDARVFGRESSLVLAEYLYGVLSREIGLALADWKARGEEGDDDPALESAFCNSAVTAVDGRLAAMRGDDARTDPEGNALVVRRDHELDEWLRHRGYRFNRGARPPYAWSAAGYDAGRAIVLRDAMRAPADPENRLTAGARGDPATSPQNPDTPR